MSQPKKTFDSVNPPVSELAQRARDSLVYEIPSDLLKEVEEQLQVCYEMLDDYFPVEADAPIVQVQKKLREIRNRAC